MKKTLSILLALILIVLGYLGYQYLFPSYSINYKITVNIETPEGIKSGSTVREISQKRALTAINLPGVGSAPNVIGEAVVIDLGEKGLLFGLISDRSYKEFL